MKFIKIISFFLLCICSSVYASEKPLTNAELYAKYPWAVFYYHSWMTDNNITEIPGWHQMRIMYGTMDTVEFLHELPRDNWFRQYFKNYVATVEVAGNVTHRNDPVGSIWEFNSYAVLRWNNFIWNQYLFTTFAFGDGLSYTTNIPLRELKDSHMQDDKHLLNFLLVELTFAPPPPHSDLEFVVRIHHRCGAWGGFGAGNLSSNAIGIGFRYRF